MDVLGSGWEYEGVLCTLGKGKHGCLWEYPILAKLPQGRKTEAGKAEFAYEDQEVAKSSSAKRDHVFLTGVHKIFVSGILLS